MPATQLAATHSDVTVIPRLEIYDVLGEHSGLRLVHLHDVHQHGHTPLSVVYAPLLEPFAGIDNIEYFQSMILFMPGMS